MRKELEKNYEDREKIIGKSRKILSYSKSSIYSIQRNEIKEAEDLIKKAEKGLLELKKIVGDNKNGHFSSAMQEYVEAICFLNLVKKNKLISRKEIDCGVEDYLCGIADTTGELARKAVLLATKKDIKGVKDIRDIVDYIYGEMSKFDLRNSELRRKFDAIKWNLKKIEDLMYDLSK